MAIKLNPITGKFDFDSGNFYGVLASAPSSPSNGWMYINSGDNKLYIYYSYTWQALHTLTAATPVTGNPMGLLLTLTYS